MRWFLLTVLVLGTATFALAAPAEAAPQTQQAAPAAAPVVPVRAGAGRTYYGPYAAPRRCTPYPYYRPYYRQRRYFCQTPAYYRVYPYRYDPGVYRRYGCGHRRTYYGGPAGRAARYCGVRR